jgi:hypothetical protein
VCEKKVDFKHSRSRGLAAGRRRDGLPCDMERIPAALKKLKKFYFMEKKPQFFP